LDLFTGDDGVGLGESNIYHQLVDFSIWRKKYWLQWFLL